jgi:hypothetical protein
MSSSGSGAPPPEDSVIEEKLAAELLASARLDAPGPGARRRALEAGFAALDARERFALRPILIGAAGLAVAAAAVVVLFLRAPARVPDVRPELPPPSEAKKSEPKKEVETRRPCPEVVVARGNEPLIEDWEEQDSAALRLDGRSGNWLTFDDGTAKQNVASSSQLRPSRLSGGRSRYGLHLSGGRFSDWGVSFGTDLATGSCYDASAYDGIAFWAKGEIAVYVGVQVIDVQSPKFGGFCSGDSCYNSHRKRVNLSPTWQRHVVRWSELEQLNPSGRFPLDTKRIRFLEFTIMREDTPFDLWIDDVSFVTKAAGVPEPETVRP